MSTSTTFNRRKLPTTFDGLGRLHPLRPIADDVALENAREVADALAVLPKRTADQEDYLESLSVLMEHYENQAHPMEGKPSPPSPVEALRYLMEANGMSESDLGRLLGERSLGNAVLSGRRQLSKAHVRILADRFKVRADLFL